MNTPKKKFNKNESEEANLDDAPIANKHLPDEDDDEEFDVPLDEIGGFDDLDSLDDEDDDF